MRYFAACSRSPVLLALFLAACSVTDPGPKTPVAIRVAGAPAGVSAAVGSGDVVITELRLAVANAGLGSGGQFGCINCQGGSTVGESASDGSQAGRVTDIPLDGSGVEVAIEEASPGRYQQAEISLAAPAAGVSAWPSGTTIEIVGTVRGTAFQLTLAISGSFVTQLSPAVDVSVAGTPGQQAVTITLPVADWFAGDGVSLDPADATQRARIEANARRSFAGPE